jgi:hypothetical protein
MNEGCPIFDITNFSQRTSECSKEDTELIGKRHSGVMRDIDSFVQSFGSSDLRDLINQILMIEAKEEVNVAANRKTRIYGVRVWNDYENFVDVNYREQRHPIWFRCDLRSLLCCVEHDMTCFSLLYLGDA